MLRGRYDYPRSPDDLLAERPSDPIANVVAAYLWLRRGEQDRALSLASYLAERNPDWSDPYLIRGEALIRTDEATAREAYSRALTTGLPIFAGGLARLWQSIDRLHIDIDDTRRATLEHVIANRLHGVLWTAATSLPKRG
jgi:hypothetical protein